MFAEVAINIPSGHTFTYAVPQDMQSHAAVGKRALVPFGSRRVTGYITSLVDSSEREQVKDIITLLDMEPLFDDGGLTFYRWMADYYMHPLGKALKGILPGGIDIENHLWIRLAEKTGKEITQDLTAPQRTILATLEKHPRGLSLTRLKKDLTNTHLHSDLATLQNLGLLHTEDRLTKPAVRVKKERFIALKKGIPPPDAPLTEKQRSLIGYIDSHGEVSATELRSAFSRISDTLKRLESRSIVTVTERDVYRNADKTFRVGQNGRPLTLNAEQEAALSDILQGLSSRTYRPYLLHGVTGSGKTEVYLRAIEYTLEQGGNAIFLVPEIALTPQMLSRITERFDEGLIAVLHSGIGRQVRYDEWRRIKQGDARIIVGARSAIFAPVPDLRLIIVDEEHDPSYKQDERLPYNARDLAVVRAHLSSATVILGSATPAVQTYHNTGKKNFAYLQLTRRVEDRPMPSIDIVDMKKEREEGGNGSVFSRTLHDAIGDTLAMGKQTLLFLNRRGFTTFLFCNDCGYVFRCRNCAVSMTHHLDDGTLRCHYCDYTLKAPPLCPSCGGTKIRSYGVGTEKLTEETASRFPGARIARMDSDTTAQRGAFEKILHDLDSGAIDILIGTQMITKGHDFPNVTLVGVISADTGLSIPDFRSAEKTFQILTQVSGRGGRGDTPGRVIIQTFNPDHYALRHARHHDYSGFYEEERAIRQELGYPPFGRLVCFRISGTNERRVEECARELGTLARACAGDGKNQCRIDILGPAEAPIAKIKGRYRRQMLLKADDIKTLHRVTRMIMTRCTRRGPAVKVDVDPMNFM